MPSGACFNRIMKGRLKSFYPMMAPLTVHLRSCRKWRFNMAARTGWYWTGMKLLSGLDYMSARFWIWRLMNGYSGRMEMIVLFPGVAGYLPRQWWNIRMPLPSSVKWPVCMRRSEFLLNSRLFLRPRKILCGWSFSRDLFLLQLIMEEAWWSGKMFIGGMNRCRWRPFLKMTW